MSVLPLARQPRDDEAWLSYLTRVAAAHACSISVLAEHIGLASSTRWPAYLGVVIDPFLAETVAPALGISTEQIQRMHLSTYDGIAVDLDGLNAPGINSTRLVSQRVWTYLSGSSYCPRCLEVDGAWNLRWRLPWTTVCNRHELVLAGQCPDCDAIPGTWNRLGASAPSRAHAPTDNRQCLQPQGADVCGADLTRVVAQVATPTILQMDSEITSILLRGGGSVAGQRWAALDVFRAWQACICLAVAMGRVETTWGKRSRWSSPPREPRLMGDLMHACVPVMHADTHEDAASVLGAWCAEAGIRTPSAHTFERSTMPAAALQPAIDALLRARGRAHTRIARSTQLQFPMTTWSQDAVPQLVWPCALPPAWRESRKPDALILRAVLAMILIRIHGASGWADAGAALGFSGDCARRWTRYSFSSAHGTLREDLLQAGFRLAEVLGHQPKEAWSDRPVVEGKGLAALRHAQDARCGEFDGRSSWCPCQDRRIPNPGSATPNKLEVPA